MINSTPITSEIRDGIEKNCSLLVFRLNEQAFALNIENVVQIIPMLRLTPIPRLDHIIEGIANIHGELVPMISTRRHLGLPDLKPGLYTPIILTRVGKRQIGWIVDEVYDVINVPLEAIIIPATILPESIENIPEISGFVYQSDVSILVLDPRFILRSSQFCKVNRAFPSGTQTAGTPPDSDLISSVPGDDLETLLIPPLNREALEIVRTTLVEEQNELKAENQAQQTGSPSDLNTPILESAASKSELPLADTSQSDSKVSDANLQVMSEVDQTPEPDVKGRKRSTKRNGKANSKKGTIIPNTSVKSKQEQPPQQASVPGPIGCNIKTVLASQFSVLADELRETEKQNDSGA